MKFLKFVILINKIIILRFKNIKTLFKHKSQFFYFKSCLLRNDIFVDELFFEILIF
jgi:hypothetical protein